MATTSRPRAGRPAGSDGHNRDRILAAARDEFAAAGFRGATLRAIAARAGFDVSLIAHYFGNKDGLFAATLELPPGTGATLAAALSAPAAEQGERLTRAYLTLWEDPRTLTQMRALARSALTMETAAARMQGLIGGVAADPALGDALAGRRTGFTLAVAHLLGIAAARYLLAVPGLRESDLDLDALVERVAPAVEVQLQAPDPAP